MSSKVEKNKNANVDVIKKAYNLANRNLETINKIEDRNKWLWRTSVGALITGLIGILILFIKLGLGIN